MNYGNLCIILAGVILCSCEETDSASSTYTVSSTSQTLQISTSDTQAEKIEVKALDYNLQDRIFTYEYNGNKYTVILRPENFKNDVYNRKQKQLSQQLIALSKEHDITAVIELNSDKKIATSCDVISPNVELYTNYSLHTASDEYVTKDELEVTAERISGSVFKLYNGFGEVIADLNDLDDIFKPDIPDKIEKGSFVGYRFKDGYFIIKSLSFFSQKSKDGNNTYISKINKEKYHFFGKIQSLSDGRATVLLNDGKTACDVPTYYNDGELTEGQQVMVTLNAEPSLYGSGEQYKADYAVFITNFDFYGIDVSDFDSLAYAHLVENDLTRFECVTVDDIT